VTIELIPLKPLRDMIEIKGPLAQLIQAECSVSPTGKSPVDASSMAVSPTRSEDYVRAILTDEGDIYDAIGQLRQVYPNIMRIDFANSRSRQDGPSKTAASGDVARKGPLDLFSEFFINQNNTEMTLDELALMQDVLRQAGGVSQ
jgi:exonuclease SbcD